MTKYTSNEQYERDKISLIHIAEKSMLTLIENADVIANLLKQSKWVGVDETQSKTQNKKETKGGFFWDDDEEDSDFYLI